MTNPEKEEQFRQANKAYLEASDEYMAGLITYPAYKKVTKEWFIAQGYE